MSKYRVSAGFLGFCLLSFIFSLLVVGCNPIWKIGGDADAAPQTYVTGSVVSSSLITPAGIRADVAPKQPVVGADVFIENFPTVVVKTDAEGKFVIGPVPPADYRVIARVLAADNKTYKEISSVVNALPAGENSAGELELKEAALRARGRLTNPDGTPLVGITLRMWGEDVVTDANGEFRTPLMPFGTTERMLVVSGGFQMTGQTLPAFNFDFLPDDNPPFMEIPLPGVNAPEENFPPFVTFLADKLRVNAGETVTFTATAVDPEGEALNYTWTAPVPLNIAQNQLSATWTAVNNSGIATFTFKARDPEGLETSRNIVIAVNTGSQIPLTMPPLDVEAPAAPAIAGVVSGSYDTDKSFTVTGIEQGATVEYSLDNGSTWLAYTTEVVLTRPGIGENVEKRIVARQTDGSGNVSALSEIVIVTLNGPTPVYSVAYNANGATSGSAPTDGNTYQTGVSVTLAGAGSMLKTGYAFAGWNTAANGSGTDYAAAATMTMGGSAVTLYAKWTAVSYNITYNLNDGTNDAANPAGFTVETATITLQNPTRTNYTFAGWYGNAEFTGDAVTQIAQGSTANVALYAKWTAVSYAITYNLNDGTNHVDNPANFTIASETITLQSPTRAGFTFLGWYGNAEFTGDAVTQIAQGSTANVALYAKWTAISYTITYNLNDGTNDVANPADFTVETATITLQNPTRANYTFAGWYSNAEFTGGAVTQIAQGSTGDKTFFARWIEPISFDLITPFSLRVSWENIAGYQYKVVRAASAEAVDTYAEADAVAAQDVVLDWTDGVSAAFVNLLKSNTTYYLAVIAKKDSDRIIYTPASAKTTQADSFAIQALLNNNILVVYKDKDDSDKGKKAIYNSTGAYVSGPDTVLNLIGTGWDGKLSLMLNDSNDVVMGFCSSTEGPSYYALLDGETGQVIGAQQQISARKTLYGPALALGQNGLMFALLGAHQNGLIQGSCYAMFDIDDNSVVKAETTLNAGGNNVENRGIEVCRIGDNSFFVMDSRGWDTFVPRYRIFDSTGAVIKAETAFATTKSDYFVASRLANGNAMVAYQDKANSNKGKIVVYNAAGDVVVGPVTFTENEVADWALAATLADDGQLFIVYSDNSDNSNAKSALVSSNGTLTQTENSLPAGVSRPFAVTNFPNLAKFAVMYKDTSENKYWFDFISELAD